MSMGLWLRSTRSYNLSKKNNQTSQPYQKPILKIRQNLQSQDMNEQDKTLREPPEEVEELDF